MGTRTSVEELGEWFDQGIKEGATHMIVVCDAFSHEDYPVYVSPTEDVVRKVRAKEQEKFVRIMEVYAMHLDKGMQMSEGRAFHYEGPPMTGGVGNEEVAK